MPQEQESHIITTSKQFKEKLVSGGPCLGTWISLSDPSSAELMASLGFDFTIIDIQHSPIHTYDLQSLLMAFKGSQTVPIVRVGENDFAQIDWALDVGAGGILVPMVDTAEQAREIIRAAKYPPLGSRSIGSRRAGGYGLYEEAYLQAANDSLIVLAQVETKAALENLDALLQVEGIDCFFVGPNDLGASLHGLVDRRNPEMAQTLEDILHNCQQAGKPFGVNRGDAEAAQEWFAKGASLIAVGEDTYFMFEAATQFLRKMGRA